MNVTFDKYSFDIREEDTYTVLQVMVTRAANATNRLEFSTKMTMICCGANKHVENPLYKRKFLF